jgi:hypothetical protein
MTCRIERVGEGENFVIFRVVGRIEGEHVDALRELLAQENGRVALSL